MAVYKKQTMKKENNEHNTLQNICMVVIKIGTE